jgi:predicted ATP-binding protein involved in virulence
MLLSKIHIQNFRCLQDIELSFELGRNWSLLLGENGTGKSNFLKAIALVTCGSSSLGELLGDTDQWIKAGEQQCRIMATIETKNGDPRAISLILDRGDSLSKVMEQNKTTLSLIDAAIEKADRNYFVMAYGAHRRLSTTLNGNSSEKNRFGRTAHIKSLFDSTVQLNLLNAWIIDLDYRSGEAGLELVRDTLHDFLPDVSFSRIDKEQKKVYFKTLDAEVPLELLSDGYQIMAAWIGDLLFRITDTFGDHKSPLNARGLILVDEIDLHLHPKWQRKLYDFISHKLPNFQIIATTHSALTAQQVGEGELFALKRNTSNQIELLAFVGSPQTMKINQLLMSPVFGLDTDEGVLIEKTKEIYTKGKGRSKKTVELQDTTTADAIEKLEELSTQPTLRLLSDTEMDLLNRIDQKLQNQKQK